MNIEYVSELKAPGDTIDLYKALQWYQLSGYTDEDIEKANNSFYSVYAYDGDKLIGLGRVASDGLIAAVMSGICVRTDYRRHGIGAEIVRRLVEYCQTGIYKMNVQIFCEDSLIGWYENMGFERMAVGMRKPMPMREEHCALRKNFGEIYGIELITDLSEDFYWYDFDSFGDFNYYCGIGSEGVKVPFIRMMFYCTEPVRFSAEIIFENVSEFEIGCLGVRTPLLGFDIICTEKYGYADRKRYKVRSLEDDDISFFCEKFRIMDVTVSHNTAKIKSEPAPLADDDAYKDLFSAKNNDDKPLSEEELFGEDRFPGAEYYGYGTDDETEKEASVDETEDTEAVGTEQPMTAEGGLKSLDALLDAANAAESLIKALGADKKIE